MRLSCSAAQDTSAPRATRVLRALLLGALLGLGGASCRTDGDEIRNAPALAAQSRTLLERLAEEPAPAAGLRVRLAFPASADLDLFVTGPHQEAVYFANERSELGGELERDERCGGGGDPRVETVRFREPPPGRYRVGIDFPARCDSSSDPVAFAVALEHAAHAETRTGVIRPQEFLTIVLEHEVVAVD